MGCVLLATIANAAPGTGGVAGEMAEAAQTLQKSLPAAQREQMSYAFEDSERFDLRLAPLFLEGLEMAGPTRRLARGLPGAGRKP